ncbi:hypothetical protein [Frankia sp. Cj5]|uniref:hypothetical protein n=1 Tax=Frankia sp. Cj5 TaxID=2880978 RepID=UPI001EF66B62|nr:hypothetical protein [Frankia sp. Cj5]
MRRVTPGRLAVLPLDGLGGSRGRSGGDGQGLVGRGAPMSMTGASAVPPDSRGGWPRHLLVATDFSGGAAQVGVALAPRDARRILVHSTVVIGENLMRMSGVEEDAIALLRSVQLEQARARIEGIADALDPAPHEVVVESGRPEVRVHRARPPPRRPGGGRDSRDVRCPAGCPR